MPKRIKSPTPNPSPRRSSRLKLNAEKEKLEAHSPFRNKLSKIKEQLDEQNGSPPRRSARLAELNNAKSPNASNNKKDRGTPETLKQHSKQVKHLLGLKNLSSNNDKYEEVGTRSRRRGS